MKVSTKAVPFQLLDCYPTHWDGALTGMLGKKAALPESQYIQHLNIS